MGKTIEEATKLYLEEFPPEEKEHSPLTTFEVSTEVEEGRISKAK